ncbi:MAG: chemotaxis protein CheW [Gemmatimonadaceae bacterium]|nr:chemotaxis protein CheW [Gemmatimonadaceae bacterium]
MPAPAIPPGRTLPSVFGDADDDEQHARVLVVCVGANLYGIPVEQVREVFRGERVTRVPGAPALVRGIVNVRGGVGTVLGLAVLLGAARAVTSSSVVLLEHGSRLIGLAVDAVRDVRAQDDTPADAGASGHAVVTPLDAVALCAPHLLSSEEMGR